jgi:hypothetical protein
LAEELCTKWVKWRHHLQSQMKEKLAALCLKLLVADAITVKS